MRAEKLSVTKVFFIMCAKAERISSGYRQPVRQAGISHAGDDQNVASGSRCDCFGAEAAGRL